MTSPRPMNISFRLREPWPRPRGHLSSLSRLHMLTISSGARTIRPSKMSLKAVGGGETKQEKGRLATKWKEMAKAKLKNSVDIK
ncbi:hypothetical protein D9619_000029 [Psilocybe cf. subviscida]|uniref:Uncharacterized protein n=1 Tax=Psilocybe cf. subviscida TaxID=2480587 RepID=A0A8H5F214_9AGAR|nr:hypothetical protein D9619_000029 [Psilocybe cf. subviscida]